MPASVFRRFAQKVDQLVTGRGRIDRDLLDDLESMLIQADVNVLTAARVLETLRKAIEEERLGSSEEVMARIRAVLVAVLETAGDGQRRNLSTGAPPTLYLVVGVNGVGKTTSIAKLAYRLGRSGKRVLVAAADTFRAAAIDQLDIWAARAGCDIVKQREGSDPSAVLFDAIRAARARGADYVIADTAGRLHTQSNLMEELKKVTRVAARELGRAPDESLLVLDATTGQNAVSQAKKFLDAVDVTGIVLAKLDGTARGGIVVTIADELKVPIKLVGTGEKLDDLAPFHPEVFVDRLFADR